MAIEFQDGSVALRTVGTSDIACSYHETADNHCSNCGFQALESSGLAPSVPLARTFSVAIAAVAVEPTLSFEGDQNLE